jgi:3-oxoacyl-[acyl-carrier protein] reductase
MDLGLQGKRALVNGASSGLGKGIAASLRREGARVAISARSADRQEAAAQDIGAEAAIACDGGWLRGI